jgi:hypothetical protein
VDSTSRRTWARALRSAALILGLGCAGQAAALNHVNLVSPIAPGRFAVACSNVAQDTSRIAPGLSASDYWEGRYDHYVSEILANPQATLRFNAPVPFQPALYPNSFGRTVPFVVIVCHPTPRSNSDPGYVLPFTGEVIPHMQPAGSSPKLIDATEYLTAFGLPAPASPSNLPARLPLIVYSHGLTGSPISQGYVQVMVELAAQGYVVAAPFHGDPRFSRVRIEDVSDFFYLLFFFPEVAEMQAMRPLSLKAMTDLLLSNTGFAQGIDTDRIGGFGASLGGEAMALLLGAKLTSNSFGGCSEPVHDPRIKAAVGYVPFAGWSFLPAFCDGQEGARGVNRPYLAISGTADTTAPIGTMQRAMDKFQGSRYLVELIGGQHEFRPEDAGDLFTWMITFLDAYLGVPVDPGAMARFIRMNGVAGGRLDHLVVDVHQPFASGAGEAPALEFYNTIIGHYFITNGAGEIDGILHGSAGPGWELTGQAFRAWTSPPPLPAPGAAAVCRFYGTPGVGPNSHFYTNDSAECDSVKRSVGWTYEGISFFVRPFNADHTCPDGYLAVNRAYNNRAAQNDSNHRYSTSDSVMAQMQALGWVYEGNSMCALP